MLAFLLLQFLCEPPLYGNTPKLWQRMIRSGFSLSAGAPLKRGAQSHAYVAFPACQNRPLLPRLGVRLRPPNVHGKTGLTSREVCACIGLLSSRLVRCDIQTIQNILMASNGQYQSPWSRAIPYAKDQ